MLRAEANIARPCAILAVIHCGRASMPAAPLLPSPAPSPLPSPPSYVPPSFRPRVISADNLGGAFVLRTGNFWLVGVGLVGSLSARLHSAAAEGRSDGLTVPAFVPLHAPAAAADAATATAATPLVLNRDRRGRRHLPALHVVPHCRLNICKPLKP